MRLQEKPGSRMRTVAAACALVGLVALTGCTASSSDSKADSSESVGFVYPAGDGTDEQIAKITWAMTTGDSLNPLDSTSNYEMLAAFLEPLLKINHRGQAENVLAESVEQTDTTTIDVTIRDDVKFWDGQPLTVEDVVYSIDRARATGARQASSLVEIESVEATGADSLRIKLSSPQPEIMSALALIFIVEKDFVEDAGDTLGTPEGLVMGTGAYSVESFAAGKDVHLVRNDGYWGEAPSAEKVDIRIIPDPEALRLAVQSGEVDGTTDLPLSDIQAWEGIEGVHVGTADGANPDPFFILDTSKPPFDDIHARRAIAALVDKEGIIQAVYDGHATASRSISPPIQWAEYVKDPNDVEKFMDSLPQVPFDPELAKEELSMSATPDGFSLDLLTPASAPTYTSIAQVLREEAAKIGIELTVKPVTDAQWFESFDAKDRPEIGMMGWAATSTTPLDIPIDMVRPVPSAYSAYNSKSMQAAIDEYIDSPDIATKVEQSELVLEELAEELPFVPVVFPQVAFAMNDKYVFADEWSSWKYYGGNNWAAAIKVAAE